MRLTAHSPRAFSIEGFLDPEECEQLIALAEREGFASAGVALPEVDAQVPRGLPKDLRFYKYAPGQRFKMHKDGPWHEDGLTSQLTLLVYLNDGFTGGDTDFRDFRVKPDTGAALLFIHDTWHEGAAIESGTKYVLRSDVMYGQAP